MIAHGRGPVQFDRAPDKVRPELQMILPTRLDHNRFQGSCLCAEAGQVVGAWTMLIVGRMLSVIVKVMRRPALALWARPQRRIWVPAFGR